MIKSSFADEQDSQSRQVINLPPPSKAAVFTTKKQMFNEVSLMNQISDFSDQ